MTLNRKEIEEHIKYLSYEIAYKMDLGIEPFYEQFHGILIFINSISYRMEHEFYDFHYHCIDEKRMEENQALGCLYDPGSVVEGSL